MSALFTSMFVLGIATSFHCVGMCGPMVVTYAVKGAETGSWIRRMIPNAAYQGARISSYVFVGLALGAIGSAFDLGGLRPWILLAAGVFMIVLGLGMTGKVPWAARLMPRPPQFMIRALSRLRRKARDDEAEGAPSLATPVAFGLLTGLMPCAPLQGAQIASAATGSAVLGGTAMLAFGLGTMPLLLAFGTTASLIPIDWKRRLNVVLTVVVIVFGVVFISRGAVLLGSPLSLDSVRMAIMDNRMTANAASYSTAADGVVEVPFAIMNDKYVPESVSVPANVPVRLMVKRQKGDCAHGGMCASEIVIKQLDVDAQLAPLTTTAVDLPATPPGTYTMSSPCGMITGRIVAE